MATPAATGAILTLNAGSSSLKFKLYDETGAPSLRGALAREGGGTGFSAEAASGETVREDGWEGGVENGAARLVAWVEDRLEGRPLAAVAHRIVHGGTRFAAPCRIDRETLAALEALTPLAPLHQPRGLAPIRLILAERPDLPQIGCFDTAFHRTIPAENASFALAAEWRDKGLARYGFHGLSFEHVADRLPAILPGRRRVVAAHLGSGASLCALLDGRSVDTTMGFSALDGLVMGTRPGLLDPGVILWWLREEGLSAERIEDILYHESGLLGLSGLSADVRDLEASEAPEAKRALDIHAARIARETAAMAASLGGIDGFVFTGGVGEHAPEVRRRVCERLSWLGFALDARANREGRPHLSQEGGAVAIRLEPADEEVVMARMARRALSLPPI